MVVPAATVTIPVPVLTSVSPAKVAVGSASFILTVTGSGFVPDSKVAWNGTSLSTVFVSSTSLKATVPATAIAAVGTAKVAVTQSGKASVGLNVLVTDLSPPVTTWTVSSPSPKLNGWYRGPVTVTVSATDPDGPSDVSYIQYSLDATPFATYSVPVVISGDKAHNVTGRSVDKAKNVGVWTVSIYIDGTAPATKISYSAGLFSLAATDALSGVATTVYSVDGAATKTYTGPFSSTMGHHTITYYSSDRAGNVEVAKTAAVTL